MKISNIMNDEVIISYIHYLSTLTNLIISCQMWLWMFNEALWVHYTSLWMCLLYYMQKQDWFCKYKHLKMHLEPFVGKLLHDWTGLCNISSSHRHLFMHGCRYWIQKVQSWTESLHLYARWRIFDTVQDKDHWHVWPGRLQLPSRDKPAS